MDIDILNTQTQLPIVVLVDTSTSMRGQPEEEVRNGLLAMYKHLNEDKTARYAVTLSIIHYNSSSNYDVVLPFTPIHKLNYLFTDAIPHAYGNTYMAGPLALAINSLDRITSLHQQHGISQYRPILVVMSDGKPYDIESTERVAARLREMENEGKLSILPLAVNGADKAIMDSLSNNGSLSITDDEFTGVFKFISASASSIASGSVSGVSLQSQFHSYNGVTAATAQSNNTSAWDNL